MSDLQTLRGAVHWQGAFCRQSGSPISALAMAGVAEALGTGGAFDRLLAPWAAASAEAVFADAAPLRVLGGLHYLVLSGRAPALAALYQAPPEAVDPRALAEALVAAAADHGDVMAAFMASPPQTNEVGRALILAAGFLTVAQETGLPLRCLELGASAGLNMNWDRFAYRFGDAAAWGGAAAPVQLAADWTGGAPPTPGVRVVERRACDQNPIDVADPHQALVLQSYVWAGQDLRMARLQAAIAVKRETGGVPDRADAADWAEAWVAPVAGAATVVYHSSFIAYPPAATQDRIRAAILAAGAKATAAAPLAWVTKEPEPGDLAGPDALRLRVWPGGEDRLLARCHPHGAWVRWAG